MPNVRLASRPQERKSAESLPIEQPGPSTRKGSLPPIQEEQENFVDTRKLTAKQKNKSIAVVDKWSMWYTTKSPKKNVEVYDYLNGLVQVDTFDNVLKYWAAWNQVQQECPLKMDVDYFVFKEKIYPLWEDPNNIRGGKWSVSFNRVMTADEITQKWITFTLATCCGDFGTDTICGATLSIRPWGTTFALWNRNALDVSNVLRVAGELKVFFNHARVTYQPHQQRVQNQQVRTSPPPKSQTLGAVEPTRERTNVPEPETEEVHPQEPAEGEEVQKKKKKTRRGKRGGVKQRAKIAAREARERERAALKMQAQALGVALSQAAARPFTAVGSLTPTPPFSPYSSFSSDGTEDSESDNEEEDVLNQEFTLSMIDFALE